MTIRTCALLITKTLQLMFEVVIIASTFVGVVNSKMIVLSEIKTVTSLIGIIAYISTKIKRRDLDI